MSSSDRPHRHLHWRLAVGEPGTARGRWPVGLVGARRSVLPGGTHPTPAPGDRVARMAVSAGSVGWLRWLLDQPASLALTRRVSVTVAGWRAPRPGWVGQLGPLPDPLRQRIRLPRASPGRARVEVALRAPVPLRELLVAVLPVLTPVRPVPVPVSDELAVPEPVPSWLGVRPVTVDVGAGPVPPGGGAPAPDDLPPYDVLLSADPDRVLIDAGWAVVPGRYGPFGPGGGRARLDFAGSAEAAEWRITAPAGIRLAGRLAGPGYPGWWPGSGLTEPIRAALAGTGLVFCGPAPDEPAGPVAALLVQLAAAGVLVHAPNLPAGCAALLGPELRASLVAPLPDPAADELEWEMRTVAQRRAALRQHDASLVLPRLVDPPGTGAGLPTVSALLVTRRPERVLAAVAGIEAQTYPDLEIVLCLHGMDPPPGLRTRLARCARPIEIVTVPAGQPFGVAMGLATARARGSLLTKFDDDDSYGPEHVWDLVLARYHSGATLVGKAAEFVRLEALDVTVRRGCGAAESYTGTVAGGTILIARGDLEQLGGWRPVSRSVDLGLIDRVRRAGGLVYRTHPLGYVYHRRPDGHTWSAELEYFLRGVGAQWSGLPGYPEFGAVAASFPEAEIQGRRLPNSRSYPGKWSNRHVTN